MYERNIIHSIFRVFCGRNLQTTDLWSYNFWKNSMFLPKCFSKMRSREKRNRWSIEAKEQQTRAVKKQQSKSSNHLPEPENTHRLYKSLPYCEYSDKKALIQGTPNSYYVQTTPKFYKKNVQIWFYRLKLGMESWEFTIQVSLCSQSPTQNFGIKNYRSEAREGFSVVSELTSCSLH